MVSADLNELKTPHRHRRGRSRRAGTLRIPAVRASGNASTAVLCVELDPGKSGPRHIDMPEEILLIDHGEVEVGDERAVFGAGGLVLVPSMVPHAFRNVGRTRARIVGFFSSNTVVAIADDIVQPIGSRVIGSPAAEMAGAV
ncbi:MAG: cupin domain-containing protein [Actinobacteria bacterium]|nr:cupin domain-containing protein [Actinomycetota bacterium]